MRSPRPPLLAEGSHPRPGPLLGTVAAVLMVAWPVVIMAQVQNFPARLPAFEAPASRNLESEMMSRISLSGQLEPGDLPRLARLAVLNSISMLVNVRTDLPNSPMGYQLDQELTSLWNSSEAFYEVVSESSLDVESVAQAQYWLEAVVASQRSLEASLGELPGLSPRAAGNLQSFSRLLVPIGSVMGSIESGLANAGGPAAERPLRLDSLRREAQLVANGLARREGRRCRTGPGGSRCGRERGHRLARASAGL
jgi:hypothetical protein